MRDRRSERRWLCEIILIGNLTVDAYGPAPEKAMSECLALARRKCREIKAENRALKEKQREFYKAGRAEIRRAERRVAEQLRKDFSEVLK